MQTENALSTMESVTIVLDHCCRNLFPIINITQSLGKAVRTPVGITLIKVSANEDNAGALILARTSTPNLHLIVSIMQPRLFDFVRRSIK